MSNLDYKHFSFGVPIQAVIRIKPNLGHRSEDLKLNGDRIGILDVNNKIREEYECANIFPGNLGALDIYEAVFERYLSAALEGVNVSILAFGTSGSGKTYTIQGADNNPGIVNFFAKAVFEGLEEKKFRLNEGKRFDKGAYNYRVKVRYIEIADEIVEDLLKTASSAPLSNDLQVIPDEWEGMTVTNATWLPCASAQHLIDLFLLGKKNRVVANTEFGPLHDKSTAIFTIEIFQIAQNLSTSETTVLASRVNFVDLPCHDKLLEEDAVVREGNLSLGIFALAELIRNLSKGDHYSSYEGSLCTKLMKDMIGGNSLSLGIFCLQNSDPIGSSLVLSFMRMVRSIMNFPVANDNRLIGLLRKYRLDIIELLRQLSSTGSGSIDMLNRRIAELEKQILVHNMEKLRFNDERSGLNENNRGVKEAYNKLVKDKADLQQQLIQSEEERLRNAKQVIELQLRTTELQEGAAESSYSISTKLIQAEKEVKNALKREEKAMVSIHQAEENMRKAIADKTELEMEFIALKKNYMELSKRFSDAKVQNDRLTTEIVNLVNNNKSLANDSEYLTKLKSNLSDDYKKIASENDRIKARNLELETELLNAKTEVEQLRVEITRFDLNNHRQQIDYDNRKTELERGYLQMAYKRDQDLGSKFVETETKSKRLENQEGLLKSEVASITRQLKAAQRKILELEDHLSEYQKHEEEVSKENYTYQVQLEELRSSYRAALRGDYKGDQGSGKGLDLQSSSSLEEMIRSYNARESELIGQVTTLIATKSSLIKAIRGLRAYCRSLKNLAEDWAPTGYPLPQILTMPPPSLLEDEDLAIDLKAQLQELERLRKRNALLEQEVKALQAQLVANSETRAGHPNTKERLMTELEYLRGSTPQSSRDIEMIRKERNELKEENRKLLQQIRKNTPNEQAQNSEIDRLKRRLVEYEQSIPNNPSGSRQMQQKIAYLEEVLKKLERERSELSVRATMAEEQLKNMQEHMDGSVQNYQRKIAELTRQLQRGK